MLASRNTTWHVEEDRDETEKLSREVKEKDVVYKVNYKKVLINSSFEVQPCVTFNGQSKFYDTLHRNDPKLNAIHRWKLEEVKSIKYATQDKLVQLLGNESGSIDLIFVSVYLSTYRSFISPQTLVEKIFRNYNECYMSSSRSEPSRSNYLKSIRTLIHIWTSKYKKDFYEPPKHLLLKSLILFFQKSPAENLLGKLETILKEFKHLSVDNLVFSGFQWNISCPINAFYHLDLLSPWEFAEQLTCIDADLFCRVYLPECLGSVWSKRLEEKEKVLSVMATVEQFNHLTYRVIASILASRHAHQRARVIERWISIAQELRCFKNFASLKALTSALKSAAIYRLEKTWALVDQKHLSIYERLTKTMSDDDNQTVLRQIMDQQDDLLYLNLGIVPYLGTFLTDLTMLHASQNNTVQVDGQEAMINFEKKFREHSILTQLSLLQTSCKLYHLNFHSEFMPLFLHLPTTNAEDSYVLSCKLEPRVSSAPAKESLDINNNRTSVTFPSTLARRCSRSKKSTYERSFCNPLFDWDSALTHCWSFNSLHGKPEKKKNESRKMSMVSATVDSQLVDGSTAKEAIAKAYLEGVVGVAHFSKYKSILVSRRDTSEDVIDRILCKYNVCNDPSSFHLFQLVPNNPQLLFESGDLVLKNIQPCNSLEFLIKKKHHYIHQKVL